MKKLVLLVILCIQFGCDDTIGSDDVMELTNLEFTIFEREVTNTAMIVQGTVINTGTIKVSSPWYIEGMFYSDTTFTIILGGDDEKKNVPLEPGVGINWTLSYNRYCRYNDFFFCISCSWFSHISNGWIFLFNIYCILTSKKKEH